VWNVMGGSQNLPKKERPHVVEDGTDKRKDKIQTAQKVYK